jgi:SAM-dependent methyltransferase
MKKNVQKWIISKTYTSHFKSARVLKVLSNCLSNIGHDEIGLNVGAGGSYCAPNIINLDINAGKNINVCADAENLPFKQSVFSLIISQETIEHVRHPNQAILEMYRVLKEDGTLYCQIPFIVGFHPGPHDYWRFTREGMWELFSNCGFTCQEVAIAVGPAFGFYRIAVEFFAIFFSRIMPSLYYIFKGIGALFLYPITFLDTFLVKAEEAERIAGSFYVLASKKEFGRNV